MMDLKILGERLRQIRKHLGITQKQLAAETHLSQSALSRLENGEEVYASVMVTVLLYFQGKISYDYLFSSGFDINSNNVTLFISEDVRRLLSRHLSIVSETINSAHETSLQQMALLKKRLL